MDRYHIYEAIGKGKHSTVYKGRRKKTIQYYAIKSVDKSQRPRVLREVQVLRATDSPLVLKFHAWYETANHLWLILEYCVGGDLLSLLKQDERLPEKSIARFALDLVSALRVAHEAGVLHCDLKPSNVLIDEDGRLKLCGFGLARRVGDIEVPNVDGDGGGADGGGTAHRASSTAGAASFTKRGTPCYMAPELFRADGVHSYASDAWALGCVLYECAAGAPPFVSGSLTELMEMILNDEPDFSVFDAPDGVFGAHSASFRDLVRGLLRKDPSRRLAWDEMLAHAFWSEGKGARGTGTDAEADMARLARKVLPAQPAFEAATRAASVRERRAVAEEGDARTAPPGPSGTEAPRAREPSPRDTRGARAGGSARTRDGPSRSPDSGRDPPPEKGGPEGRRSPLSGAAGPEPTRGATALSREVVRLSLAARANLEREQGGAYDQGRTAREREPARGGGGGGASGERGEGAGRLEGRGASGDESARGGDAATASAAAAGDVSLADADAELNFAETADPDEAAAARPDSAGPTARPLSGGGNDDGDSPVSKMAARRDAKASALSLGGGGDELVADPGAAAAAAAAAAERSAERAAEEAEQAAGRDAGGAGPADARVVVQPSSSMSADASEPSSSGRGGDARDGARGGSETASSPAEYLVCRRRKLEAFDALLSSLADHPSDSQVKPIVLNRRIEVTPEPHFDASALPFEALTVSEMLGLNQPDLEKFLTRVYRCVAHSSPINEKVNALSYFETLCCDTASANVLINSSLMTLFVRMLRASKAPALRVRLTSVMGLLLRHATYVTEELAASGVVAVLTECIKDANERVRRRAAATLGELLFYIATQQHEAAESRRRGGDANETRDGKGGSRGTREEGAENDAARAAAAAAAAASAWKIPASTVGAVCRALRAGEDEIAQHYAVKTIENIVSHGGEWSAKFVREETLASLVAIMTSARDEQLRGTAASTLARAARASPELTRRVLEKYGVQLLVAGLQDPSVKAQQACLNLLIRGVGELGARAVKDALAEHRGGGATPGSLGSAAAGPSGAGSGLSPLPHLATLLERGNATLRAKALLAMAALIRRDARWLLALCARTEKALPLLDRVAKEKDPYVRKCLACLQAAVAATVPEIHARVLADVQRRKALHRANAAATVSRELREEFREKNQVGGNPLALFPAVALAVGCASLRGAQTCDDAFARDVAALLDAASDASGSFPGSEQFKADLLALLETLSRCASCLLAAPQAVASRLLPSLAECLEQREDGPDKDAVDGADAPDAADRRFLALKLVCDVLLPLLLEPPNGASPPRAARREEKSGEGSSERKNHPARKEALLSLLKRSLLPKMPRLLRDEDPIPLYALKLLGGALEADAGSLCAFVVELGLAPRFFEFLSLEHTNNNVHNVRLCLALSASRAVSTESLLKFECAKKVAAVLSYAHENAVEPFLEPALGIARAVLARAAEARDRNLRGDREGNGDGFAEALRGVAPLLRCARVLMECAVLGSTEVTGPNVPLLAADSARLLAELLPEETAAELFSGGSGSAGDSAAARARRGDDENRPRVANDGARALAVDGNTNHDEGSCSSFLVSAFESVGTAAAVARREAGFAEIGAVAPTAVSRGAGSGFGAGFGGDAGDSYAYAWAGSASASGGHGHPHPNGLTNGAKLSDSGGGSPRRGFASAQRTALEVLALLARAPRLAVAKGDAAALERTLATLARGEPNPSIAAAAGAAAQSVKGLLF